MCIRDSLNCDGIPQLVVYNKCDVANAVAFDPDILLTLSLIHICMWTKLM